MNVAHIDQNDVEKLNKDFSTIMVQMANLGLEDENDQPFTKSDYFKWSDYSEVEAIRDAAKGFAAGMDKILKDIEQLPKDK